MEQTRRGNNFFSSVPLYRIFRLDIDYQRDKREKERERKVGAVGGIRPLVECCSDVCAREEKTGSRKKNRWLRKQIGLVNERDKTESHRGSFRYTTIEPPSPDPFTFARSRSRRRLLWHYRKKKSVAFSEISSILSDDKISFLYPINET